MFYFVPLILFIVIALFVFPQFSPIPYFPSNKKDIPLILKVLSLKNNHTVIDLGAGDGIIVFSAASEAKKRGVNASFVAVEINPVLVFILHIRRLFHSNGKNIRILWVDMFKLDLGRVEKTKNTTVFLYVSPWLLAKIVKKIRTDLKKFDLISYLYPLPKESTGKKVQELKGVHVVYKYTYV